MATARLPLLSATPTRPILVRGPIVSMEDNEPTVDIIAIADEKHELNATIQIYFRSSSSTTEVLQERTPDHTFHCSLKELRQLRTDIQNCIGNGHHCHTCKRLAAYMSFCWERPRMLHRSWNGSMAIQMDLLAQFLLQLLRFARLLRVDAPEVCERHAEFGHLVCAFLQPSKEM